MTFEVKLIKSYRSQVFGTYPDATQAETIAAEHRSTGYWDSVSVLPVAGDKGPGWLAGLGDGRR